MIVRIHAMLAGTGRRFLFLRTLPAAMLGWNKFLAVKSDRNIRVMLLVHPHMDVAQAWCGAAVDDWSAFWRHFDSAYSIHSNFQAPTSQPGSESDGKHLEGTAILYTTQVNAAGTPRLTLGGYKRR